MQITDGLYQGRMGWTDSLDTSFDNLIIRNSGGEIAIDIKYKDRNLKIYEYSLVLNRENNQIYRGMWSTRTGDSGGLSCQLFDYGDNILLFGSWKENNHSLTWWAILSER